MTKQTEAETKQTVERIIDLIRSKKGENITLLDFRGISSVTDYFIIATGGSTVHIKAIADEIRTKMKQEYATSPWHSEGYTALRWVLLDYVDVVVHLFDKETRNYYNIEKLWKDAIITYIETED